MKNMMDFCIGTPCYWLIGFGIMFGAATRSFREITRTWGSISRCGSTT